MLLVVLPGRVFEWWFRGKLLGWAFLSWATYLELGGIILKRKLLQLLFLQRDLVNFDVICLSSERVKSDIVPLPDDKIAKVPNKQKGKYDSFPWVKIDALLLSMRRYQVVWLNPAKIWLKIAELLYYEWVRASPQLAQILIQLTIERYLNRYKN